MTPIIKKINRPRHPPFVDSCFVEKDNPSGKCNFWNSSLVYLSTESSKETFLVSPTLTVIRKTFSIYWFMVIRVNNVIFVIAYI